MRSTSSFARNRSISFPEPKCSYSNSGYQLAALIVERVSKQKFPAFIEQRLFKPLGMKNSSWRDDYQRIVPGRAQAYSRNGNDAPWQLNMPFMNVYGNGGMLTTVGDWLKWNAMLDSRSMGAPLVEALETQGILNDGRKISYALGLVVDDYKGIKDVSHGGSTAGYQTFLARYPEKKLSVAVLCNGTSPSAGGLGASVTDEIFGPFPAPAKVETVAVAEDELRKYEGSWQNDVTRFVNPITLEKGELRLAGSALKPIAGGAFLIGERKLTFTDANKARIQNPDGSATLLTRVADWKPTAADLAEFAGEWYSEESQAAFTFVIEGDKAFIRQRPTTSLPLRPVTKDHFSTPGLCRLGDARQVGKDRKASHRRLANARYAIRAGREIRFGSFAKPTGTLYSGPGQVGTICGSGWLAAALPDWKYRYQPNFNHPLPQMVPTRRECSAIRDSQSGTRGTLESRFQDSTSSWAGIMYSLAWLRVGKSPDTNALRNIFRQTINWGLLNL
ncbi:MAG: beta-lactamase family protein [Acidobacteria bacterium]|nr:beta-lactamase family protein [Acidobacteriota bacterium]